MMPFRIHRYAMTNSILGGLIWLFLNFLTPNQAQIGLMESLLLFAIMVLVPMIFALIAKTDEIRLSSLPFRVAVIIQPVCALFVIASYFFNAGTTAGLLAAPWFLVTALLGLCGLMDFIKLRWVSIAQTSLNFGFLYIPVGGFWLVVSRLGLQPLGFNEIIIFLTAIHFHYAAFCTLFMVGYVGRKMQQPTEWQKKLYTIIVFGIIIGMPLLAAGITYSPLLEFIAAMVFASSLILFSIYILFVFIPTLSHHRLAQILFGISALSVVGTMLLALTYAYAEVTEIVIISIPLMAKTHGIINTFGFVFCGLLGCFFLIGRRSHPNFES